MDISVLTALLAGLFSFISPCVFPLVPGYVSMLSGIGVEQLKEDKAPRAGVLSSAFAFVIGFSVVFVALGASASAVGAFLLRNRALLAPIAGALIVLFGLHLVGWLAKIGVKAGVAVGAVLVILGFAVGFWAGAERFHLTPIDFYAIALIFMIGPSLTRWLNRDVHLRDVGGNQPGIVSGFLMGFAFAFGWTPCIGPILAGVLAIAATKQTVGQGVLLLAFYSAGLAIPFLLTALGIGRFLKVYQRFRKHLHTVEICSGVLLLAIGALVFTNQLTFLSGKLNFFQPENLIPGARSFTVADSTSHNVGVADQALAEEPNVTFTDLQGANLPLSSLKGKVVLVNFWATWCDPCFAEVPTLITLQQKYGSKNFELIGVAMDEDGKSVVAPFVQNRKFDVQGQQMAMNYQIVLGNDDITTKFGGLLGYPTTFVITPDGKIARKIVGGLNLGDMENEIQGLMR
ncbi:MAG TPA: cytochrome c biogenesis protein CcdA [Candidatus Aquilonibacter sp.]|nr:cytochrome c biogenesis protein CcdA [Candidatus Aquilonibacter sp.]